MARRKKPGRNISGILIFDKPLDISSNHAVQRVKRHFFANKAGHTGSLDPLATGVLPICLGNATKVSSFLLASDKGYRFVMKLGQTTTTGDAEGEVLLERPVPEIKEVDFIELLLRFSGKLQQIPPMYSALKHKGERLYTLARRGETVERPPRDIHIKVLELVSINEQEVTVDVLCTKGTYVRTLAEDIGEALGCGAHLVFLRRTKTGPFDIQASVTLEQLEACDGDYQQLDQYLLDLDVALLEYPKLNFSDEQKVRLCMGQKVIFKGVPEADVIRMYDENGDIFGLGKYADVDEFAPVKIFN